MQSIGRLIKCSPSGFYYYNYTDKPVKKRNHILRLIRKAHKNLHVSNLYWQKASSVRLQDWIQDTSWMWQMQIGWEKLNVTNVYRQKKSIVSWTNELLKWLPALGIHYPHQQPAEAPVCGANAIGGNQPCPTLEQHLAHEVFRSSLWNARVWKSLEVFNLFFLWGWYKMLPKHNK